MSRDTADDSCSIFGSATRSMSRRRASYRALVGSLSPRSDSRASASAATRFFCEPVYEEEPRHFLDSCFLCKKPLGGNRDIFMYRGDTPFCSEECRQEQIDMDEAKEEKKGHHTSRRNHHRHHLSSEEQATAKVHSLHAQAAETVVAG